MLRQFNRFLILIALIAVALYITLTNSSIATITVGPNLSITAYAGVIYIGVFALGCLVTSVIALIFGFKGYLRERRLRSAERARQLFFKSFENARNLMAAHDWGAARDAWEHIISKEEDNVIARVELSRCLEQLGDPREALRVLDSTRASSRASTEVLFRAAELNRSLGNNTAASDNLNLIITATSSRRALELARDSCESMGRIPDALEFQNELERLGYNSREFEQARCRLTFASLISDAERVPSLREDLVAFVKRNSSFVPALEKLAHLELSQGNLEECAALLIKAAKAAPEDLSKWKAVVDLWLHTAGGDFNRRAERAIAAAKSATQGLRGHVRLEAEILLIRTLLDANRYEEAEQHIEAFKDLAAKENTSISREISSQLLIQKGVSLAQMGKARDTAPLWKELANPSGGLQAGMPASTPRERQSEPSPVLSTP